MSGVIQLEVSIEISGSGEVLDEGVYSVLISDIRVMHCGGNDTIITGPCNVPMSNN